jgi:hypothetical protein
MPTKSQAQATDVSALLRARTGLFWIVTREEARVERHLFEAAASAGYIARTWDCGEGVQNIDGTPANLGATDIGETLTAIRKRAGSGVSERGVWVLRDAHKWVGDTPVGVFASRQLRNLARYLPTVRRECAQAIFVITPSGEVPPDLAGHATVIDWPNPDREEIASILDAAITNLPDELKAGAAANGTRDAAIDAAVGLTGEEAASCYAKSLVQTKRIDPIAVAKEKKRVIAREKVLEWIDPIKGGLDAVGGLDGLKAWLVARKVAYSPKARAYGLPSPKGCLLVGVPGCGKSLTAKAIATAWGIPLLRMDLGALKSKYVGESEQNLRRAFRVIESVGRCVVWLDELEKALAGASQGAADGGVSSDALGAILSWMQDRSGEAFVIATANDVSALPAELLRKGRWDELWFIDLPNQEERVAVLEASLRQHGRDPKALGAGVALVARDSCNGFSGAEIAALVPEALFASFADGEREVTSTDLHGAACNVVPMSKTSAAKIAALKEWQARCGARPATTVVTQGTSTARVLDL